jgi:hypothetical protein
LYSFAEIFQSGELLCRFTGHEDYINDIAVVDGNMYTGCHDTSIVCWNLQLLLAKNFFTPCCDIDYLTHYDHNERDLKNEDAIGRNVFMFLGSYGSLECLNTLINDFNFNLEKKNTLGERYVRIFLLYLKNSFSALYLALTYRRLNVLKHHAKRVHFTASSKLLSYFKERAKQDDLKFFKVRYLQKDRS